MSDLPADPTESTESPQILVMRERISELTAERDGYRQLAESTNAYLNHVTRLLAHCSVMPHRSRTIEVNGQYFRACESCEQIAIIWRSFGHSWTERLANTVDAGEKSYDPTTQPTLPIIQQVMSIVNEAPELPHAAPESPIEE